jgi:hypothetical protein
MARQQQHSSNVQFGQSLGDSLSLHSCGVQPQSAHFMAKLGDQAIKI